jgi:hypothetical protein
MHLIIKNGGNQTDSISFELNLVEIIWIPYRFHTHVVPTELEHLHIKHAMQSALKVNNLRFCIDSGQLLKFIALCFASWVNNLPYKMVSSHFTDIQHIIDLH